MKRKIHQSHQSKLTYLLALLVTICLTDNVFSQDDEETESPYFAITCNDTSVVDFPLISTNVEATISGVIANVDMEQVYVNTGDSVLDATYVFPMSTNAAVYSMKMVIGKRVINAVIKRKEEAQAIYDAADSSGYTAALLEQERSNVFKMSIANIQAGDTLMVSMTYTELIEPEKGVYQFVLPSIVGPRYSTDGESWVTKSHNDSLAVSATVLNIDLTINAGMPVTASCSSHDVTFTNEGEKSYCSLETNPGKDFIVNYTLYGNEIETGLLLYEGEDENFFLSIIQPPDPEVDYVSPSREYVFIMDVSGSMSGDPIETSKDLIVDLLNDLNSTDKFNIVFFAGGSSVLSENSLAVTTFTIKKATEMIEEMDAGGGTNLLPAMKTALDMEGTANYARTFVIMTDGYVTVEKEAYDLIRNNLGDANFFSFGIGSSVNREIIEGIAYVGCGESFVVTDTDEADSISDTFKEYIESPALTNIEATFSGINAYDIEPLSIPDVFAERPIIIYGKYDNASAGSITVSGDYNTSTVSSTLDFADYSADSDENIALKYLWARRRIKLMSDYGIASNEDDTLSIEEEITQLGLKYSLITNYTSFVAVDSSSITGDNSTTDDVIGDDESYDYATSANDVISESESFQEIIQIIGSNITTENSLNIMLSGIEDSDYDDLTLSIVSLNGSVLTITDLSGYNSVNGISVDISELAGGVYFLRLQSENTILDSKRFVVVR